MNEIEIKQKIDYYIEMLPMTSQADYELAMLGIELQEELYSQCKGDTTEEIAKIKKRLEAFDLLTDLREKTKVLLSALGEEQVIKVGNQAKGLRKLINKRRNENNPEQ